jgi:hypothetical protein
MSKKAAIPDAWDDDWESQADKVDAEAEKAKAEEQVKVSKAERLAKHAETNKKIWESAYVGFCGTHFLDMRQMLIIFTEKLQRRSTSLRRVIMSLLKPNSSPL